MELGVCQEDENGVGSAENARWCAWRGLGTG